MKREDFINAVSAVVTQYIDMANNFDPTAQIRVNPDSLEVYLVNGSDMLAEIEDANEAIEDAAAATGAENEDATDYQVSQNPDFYEVSRLVFNGRPDKEAIEAIADKYFGQD